MLALLSSCLFIFLLRERNKKRSLNSKHLYEHLEQLYKQSKAALRLKDEKIQKLTKRVSSFAGVEDREDEKMRIYSFLKERINSQKRLSEKDWTYIASLMDEIYPSLKTTLVGLYGFDVREYRISMLVKLELLNLEIATVMLRTPSAITQKRAAMYRKVFGKEGSARDFDDFVKSL